MSVFKRPIGRWMLAGAAILTFGVLATLWMPTPTSYAQGARQCLFNNDCQNPLVCAGGFCRAACVTDRDCHNGWVCVAEVWAAQRFVRRATQSDVNTRQSIGVCRSPYAEAEAAAPGGGQSAAPAAEPLTTQYGWARYGTNIGDRIDLVAASPGLCAAACAKEDGCRSWTYVKPGYQAKHAVCWIKSDNPAPVPDECCVTDAR